MFRNLASHQGNIRGMGSDGVVPTRVAIGSKASAEVHMNCLIAL